MKTYQGTHGVHILEYQIKIKKLLCYLTNRYPRLTAVRVDLHYTCSNNNPNRKYSFSSIVTINTELAGFNNSLATSKRRSIKASHLLCRYKSCSST
ncbi:inovirus-type Gp2 protein [Escherichia coli]|nr:inovirus-type Gp2 protein [Escherichia coli]